MIFFQNNLSHCLQKVKLEVVKSTRQLVQLFPFSHPLSKIIFQKASMAVNEMGDIGRSLDLKLQNVARTQSELEQRWKYWVPKQRIIRCDFNACSPGLQVMCIFQRESKAVENIMVQGSQFTFLYRRKPSVSFLEAGYLLPNDVTTNCSA